MSNLADEMNISPKRRITIPVDHVAVVIPYQLYAEVIGICKLIRRDKRQLPEEKKAIHDIAGDLLLALVETDDGQ